MKDFNYFKRGQCPICNGAAKNCRQSNLTDLIFCRSSDANPIGFAYRGIDAYGFGMWASAEDAKGFSSQAREEQERRRQEFITAQAKRREQGIASQLSAIDRDKYYHKVLDQLRLSKSDNEKLLARGFTQEQIIADSYRSVSPWHKLTGEFPSNLPGILPSNCLNVYADAILCPIRDIDGLIVGCQFRLHKADNGRYRWLTSATNKNKAGARSHLNAELPLGVFKAKSCLVAESIWITEGTTIKPSLTRHLLNAPVIGAASGRFDNSSETTKTALASLSAKYQTKLLTIAVDAGDVVNRSVYDRWQEQFKFFTSLGYECRVAWWGQTTKDHCDIDELTDTAAIAFISPDEFLAIVEEHKSDKLAPQPVSKDSLSNWEWQQWLKSREFVPDIVLDQEEFEFPKIPDSNVIVAVKSGLGTGKTKALIKLMKLYDHVRSMIIGYRNNLLFQQASRALEKALTLYHLREDDGINMLADVYTKLLFCLDSIHHVDGYFKGVDIYIDEVMSVLLHAANGGTLGDRQAKALAILTRALNVCNRVFILDGNVSDSCANFVAKLAPEKRLIKIENKRKIPPHTIKFIEGVNLDGEIKKRDKSALFKAMFDDGHIPWISCDSKKQTKIIDKIFKQQGKIGYVVNSETVSEDWAKECLANPDKFIENKKPDYFIVSPSCESGISVTHRGHFTVKFSSFCGVQGTNSQHQMMFRLRDDSIPHYVFCPEKSMVRNRSNPKTYSEKVFKQILTERVLQSAIFAATDSNSPETVTDIITKAFLRNNDDWFDFDCQLGALDNFEKDNLRKCLIHVLQEAGHNVEIIQRVIDETFKQKAKEADEAIHLEHSQELFVSVEYESVDEANRISKTGQCKETQRRIEKTWLLDRLPGIKDSGVWCVDFILKCHVKDRDFINKQQRFWLLNNFAVSQKRNESNWFYQATKEDFFIASMKRISHSTIWALKELNILQFLKGEWYKDSPEVIEFIQKARTPEIALALKTQPKVETISGQERIEFLSSLLAMLGIKFKKQCQRTIDGIRQRIYSVDSEALEDSYRIATLAAIEIKFTKWMQDKSQIEWVETPTAEAAAETEMDLILSVAEKLSKAESKICCDELFLTVNEEQKQQAWELLTVEQQTKIWSFYPKPQEYQLLTSDQELVASNQELATTPKGWEPSSETPVMSYESDSAAIQIIDTAIISHDPLCDLEALPTELKWRRRLGRALVLGADSAKKIYQLVPSQILQTVWQGLTQSVQNSYIQLFEVNNYG